MTPPRPKKDKGLPDYLTFDPSNGIYRYTNPLTKKRTWLSRDRAECIATAKALNAQLLPRNESLAERVLGGSRTRKTWRHAVDKYLAERFTELELAEKTEQQYRIYYRKIRECDLAPMNIGDIEVVHVSEALDGLTSGKRMRNVYRQRMVQVFKFAVQLGWCDEDKASVTHTVSERRQRERLTMAGFNAVRAAADPWLQCAMDVALVTLQRREELVLMRHDAITNGVLPVVHQKTGRRLRIHIGSELARALTAARADGLVCPYVIRRKPYRIKPRAQWSEHRDHAFQLMPDQLTEAFSAARIASGFYQNSVNPPTLHEIRSLGADRYRQAGWEESTIQALLGHEDIETTKLYLAGHERPWEDVVCGLDAR